MPPPQCAVQLHNQNVPAGYLRQLVRGNRQTVQRANPSAPLALGMVKPAGECASHAIPKGSFACVHHTGGNSTDLCGYNAARVLVADAGKTVWWNPPESLATD